MSIGSAASSESDITSQGGEGAHRRQQSGNVAGREKRRIVSPTTRTTEQVPVRIRRATQTSNPNTRPSITEPVSARNEAECNRAGTRSGYADEVHPPKEAFSETETGEKGSRPCQEATKKALSRNAAGGHTRLLERREAATNRPLVLLHPRSSSTLHPAPGTSCTIPDIHKHNHKQPAPGGRSVPSTASACGA